MKLELKFKENNQMLDMSFGQFQDLGGGSDIDIVTEIDLEAEYDDNDVPSMGALVGVVESLGEVLATKQDTLVSAQNIKTINGQSILGEGNLSVSGGSASGDKWTIVEQTFTYEGGESGTSGTFNLTPKTPSVSEFTEAYLWAKLSSTTSGTHRINFCSDRVQIVASQQIGTTPTRLAVHVVKIGDTLYAESVSNASVKAVHSGFTDSLTLYLNIHWSTIGANEVITSVGGIMYR